MKHLGLIVNPIAGMGGRVGLKGTDGAGILKAARELGAEPTAPARAAQALNKICCGGLDIRILTCDGAMGEESAAMAGLSFDIVYKPDAAKPTGSEDTRRAAGLFAHSGCDLLLFAGGDGTARDIAAAVGTDIPALGIPAGVKIHSAVFANTPARAGELACLFLAGRCGEPREMEVMDIDEKEFREGRVRSRLYGYLKTPFEKRLLQSGKSSGGRTDRVELDGMAEQVVRMMALDVLYLVGPGSTTAAVMEKMGLKGTLLGVDAVKNHTLTGADLSENDILKLIASGQVELVVTVIGGQGHIFGRGNQQISPAVIRAVGPERIHVIASPSKMREFFGKPLLVDTGDPQLDMKLTGYKRVITGLNQELMARIEC